MDHAVLHAFFSHPPGRAEHWDWKLHRIFDPPYQQKILVRQPGLFRWRHDLCLHDRDFFPGPGCAPGGTGEKWGSWSTVIAFFGGMLLIALIDKCIPSEENPHEVKSLEADTGHTTKLMRMGVMTALAIAIHNFPEGLATFVSALQDPSIAIPIVVAIAIHNIPEGIAVSVPIYHATGSKGKAFRYSFLSGLAEPVGALIGWLLLMPIMSDLVFGILFAGVAGIMVFISLDELLPSAREYGEHHLSIYGLICGMAVMAISLLLFL